MKYLLFLTLSFLRIQAQAQVLPDENWKGPITARGGKFVAGGNSQAEKEALKQHYLLLLGIISDLENYRNSFLQTGGWINLFPTTYFYTTSNEVLKIVNGEYKYPIEKMKQMVAFYDAYKWSRKNWDNGKVNNVEPHWRIHFYLAESLSVGVRERICIYSGFVLSTGIAAHVKYDLPRAIRYSFEQRYDRSLANNNVGYLQDFLKTDELFDPSAKSTIQSIDQAKHCWNWLLEPSEAKLSLANGIYEEYKPIVEKLGVTPLLGPEEVKMLRQQAWRDAFKGSAISDPNGNTLISQPHVDHGDLIAKGKEIAMMHSVESVDDTALSIDAKDVTLPEHKEFKWYAWASAPSPFIQAARSIKAPSGKSLYDELNLQTECDVKIAAIDLNEDGILGFAVLSSGRSCCGSKGCSYDWYENGGRLTVGLGTDYEVKPGRGGVTSSANKFFGLQPSPYADRSVDVENLFRYDRSGLVSRPAEAPVPKGPFLGATTPEALGKLMLKAFQTNDAKLWASLIHPELEKREPLHPDARKTLMEQFKLVRGYFMQKGVSNWNNVTFSRVTYEDCGECVAPPEKWASQLIVEFYYQGREFLGQIGVSPAYTFKGKYGIGGRPIGHMERYRQK